jgi:ADP-heptose:LPS heptosyltransferase
MYLINILKYSFPNASITYLGQKWGKEIINKYYPHIKYIEVNAPWVDNKNYFKYICELYNIRKKYKLEIFDISLDCRGDLRNTSMSLIFNIKNRIGFDNIHGKYFINTKIKSSKWNNLYSNIFSYGEFFIGKYTLENFNNDRPFKFEKMRFENEFAICIGASNQIRNVDISEMTLFINYLTSLSKSIYIYYNDDYINYIDLLMESIKDTENIIFINNNLIEYIDGIIAFRNIISMDSASAHIGVASGSNVYIIHGPSDHKKIMPKLLNIFLIKSKGNYKCAPCEKTSCNNKNYKICLTDLDYEYNIK